MAEAWRRSQALWSAQQSAGVTFAVTEMQPSPPAGRNDAWVASSPDSSAKRSPTRAAQPAHPRDVGRGVFQPDNSRQFGQALRPSRRPARRPCGTARRRG